MNEPEAPRTSVESLTTLLGLGASPRQRWQPAELAQMLRHRLDAPLRLGLSPEIAQYRGAAGAGGALPAATLRELLLAPAPPVELLEIVKRFGKRCSLDADSDVPREVAMVLYYVSIVAAQVRCGKSISGLRGEALRPALEWASAQKWVDEPIRELLRAGLEQVAITEPKAPRAR